MNEKKGKKKKERGVFSSALSLSLSLPSRSCCLGSFFLNHCSLLSLFISPPLSRSFSSEALAVHDRGPRLVVLALGDPHLLERRERRQDRAADPHRVLTLGRRDDLDLHRPGRARGDLLAHAVRDPGEHGGPAGQDDVAVEVLADVDVALHDRVERRLVDPGRLHAHRRRREQHLGAAEALGADRDDLAVGELVGLLDRGAVGRGGELGLVVDRDVGEFLLSWSSSFFFARERKRSS